MDLGLNILTPYNNAWLLQLIFAAASLETLIRSSLVSVKDLAHKSRINIFFFFSLLWNHRFSKWRLDIFCMKSRRGLIKTNDSSAVVIVSRFSRSWEDLWANSCLQNIILNTLLDTKNLRLKTQLNKVLDMIFQHLKKIILTIILIDKHLEILYFYILSICSSES